MFINLILNERKGIQNSNFQPSCATFDIFLTLLKVVSS